MSELGYLIWFIGTAVMIVLVLALGTMGSAGMLQRRRRADHDAADVRTDAGAGATSGRSVGIAPSDPAAGKPALDKDRAGRRRAA
jgi:hypothetical protein